MLTKALAGAGVALVLLVTALGDGPAEAAPPVTATTCVKPTGAVPALDTEQLGNVRQIIDIGRQRRLPPRAWAIAIAVAMQESSLRNRPDGADDSIGLFQQRPSQGWGTPAQLQDPSYAINAFYGGQGQPPDIPGLTDIPGWDSQLSFSEAAQSVQRSAYPDAYERWSALATELVRDQGQTELDCTQMQNGSAPASKRSDGSWPREACTVRPDPTTGRGCLTPRTAALVTALKGQGIGRISCWGARPQNPTSDHPSGRACDISFGKGGQWAHAADRAAGDEVAAQLIANADQWGVESIVWYGKSWSSRRPNWKTYCSPAYGCPPRDATGGHGDHVHVSVW